MLLNTLQGPEQPPPQRVIGYPRGVRGAEPWSRKAGCQDTLAHTLTSMWKQLRAAPQTDAQWVPRWPQTTGPPVPGPRTREGSRNSQALRVCHRMCRPPRTPTHLGATRVPGSACQALVGITPSILTARWRDALMTTKPTLQEETDSERGRVCQDPARNPDAPHPKHVHGCRGRPEGHACRLGAEVRRDRSLALQEDLGDVTKTSIFKCF